MHVFRYRRTILALGATALLVLAAGSFAQSLAGNAQGYAINAVDSGDEAHSDLTLTISGEWATQCPPTLEKVSLGNITSSSAELRIDARSVLGLCARQALPFSIEVNPALAMNHPNLGARIYHVSFYAADGAQEQPKLRAFTLLDNSAAGTMALTPETGFWWTANAGEALTNRTVLSIELQNGQLSVALMSYNSAGQPEWHFGAAPFNGRIAHVPLLRLEGGSDLFTTTAANPPHGESTLTLDLQFHSNAHASAWISRVVGNSDDTSLQLRSLDLVRLPLVTNTLSSAWQGDWVFVDDGITQPQRLQFDRFRASGAGRFQIEDSTSGAVLACKRDAALPELPPTSCSLRLHDRTEGFGTVEIDRMDGTRADGMAIHLLRVTH